MSDVSWRLKLKSATLLFWAIIVIGISYNVTGRFVENHLYHFTEDDYCNFGSQCSTAMADYLIKNPPEGKGLNFYDWGGYFIGKGVPTKLFVDGRMHVWINDEYQPFGDYVEMYYHQKFNLFNYYKFDWAVITDNSDIAQKLKNTEELGNWELRYQDGVSDYFVRKRQ